MKLLTKEIRNKIPRLYATEEIPNEQKKVVVKFFNPAGAATWYAVEGEPVLDDEGNEVDFEFFGAADLGYGPELGYFRLNELKSLKLPFGLTVERDRGFGKTMLSEIMKDGL